MSDIYVYPQNCDDFTNFGLVGALTPISCIFEEEANGMSEITLEHPIDAFGRFTALEPNNLLVVDVPVRTTPEINGNKIVTSVEQYTVIPTAQASKTQRTLYKKYSKKNGGKKKIKVLPGGTSVTVVNKADADAEWVKIKTRYGTGWIRAVALENKITHTIADNSQSIESVQPAWVVKPQIFRIYAVEKKLLSVIVSARHITYDLLYNITNYRNGGNATCIEALAGIMDNCVSPIADEDGAEFEAFTNLATERAGVNWTRTNPIDALLNPETGLTALYGAALVRDNWEMYVLHDPGLNRGVTVEYGKNMTGINYTENYDSIVTRIIPVGETKDGEDLLLDGVQYVDSDNIGLYPVIYTQELRCDGCKVGTDGMDTKTVRNKMKAQAQAVFEAGGDLPTVEMDVDFINLGDTAEYAQYKDLERLFLWDYVHVRHPMLGINVTSRIVSIRWDCLLERMDGMSIGAVGKTLANTGITTWQIPTGFSGNKIAPGTVGAPALGEDIISAKHIGADVISARHMQAETFTSEKANIGTLAAVNAAISTLKVSDELYANFAHVFELVANQIKAGNVETDNFAAQMANIASLSSKVAEIGYADIKDLNTKEAIIEDGVAGSLYINRLSVTSANIMNATLGELVLKGEDNQYYKVFVGSDGNIKTEYVSVDAGEIESGVTESGNQIVETTINAERLSAATIKGDSAIIAEIFTQALTAGKITAAEAMLATATIPALYTTSVEAMGNSMTFSANERIQFMLGEINKMGLWFTFDNNEGLIIQKPAWTDENGVEHPASIWSTVTDETGYHIRNATVPGGNVASFYKDRMRVDTIEMGDTLIRKMDDGGVAFFGM